MQLCNLKYKQSEKAYDKTSCNLRCLRTNFTNQYLKQENCLVVMVIDWDNQKMQGIYILEIRLFNKCFEHGIFQCNMHQCSEFVSGAEPSGTGTVRNKRDTRWAIQCTKSLSAATLWTKDWIMFWHQDYCECKWLRCSPRWVFIAWCNYQRHFEELFSSSICRSPSGTGGTNATLVQQFNAPSHFWLQHHGQKTESCIGTKILVIENTYTAHPGGC